MRGGLCYKRDNSTEEGRGQPRRKKKEKEKKTRGEKGAASDGGCRRGAGVGMKEALEEGGVFTDVDKKSLGRPAPRSLYNCWRDSMFCESSGATGSHRLASHILFEEEA